MVRLDPECGDETEMCPRDLPEDIHYRIHILKRLDS